jgi:hypothetical protein
VIAWEPEGRLRVPGEFRVNMKERLTIDLAAGRIGAYRAEAQYRSVAPREQWRWITMDVSVTSPAD